MLGLLWALVGVLLLGGSWEGVVRAPGVLAACAFVRVGRVRGVVWGFRPGRVYVRVGRV